MSYKVSFVTKKTYIDGTEKITVKNGYLTNHEKAQRTKRRNQLRKELELQSIMQTGQLSFDSLEREQERLAEFEKKYAPKLSNAVRSMNRSKNNLMDILRCNTFDFFVTLTFDDTKLNNTYDDTQTRNAFRKWRKSVKRSFPDMVYIAIEEYQKRGVLHYHLLVGNVTADELGLVNSGKKVRRGRCKGQPIFNVTKWQYGFSTVTQILDTEAVKFYLSKYLTKGQADPRFFGKKRYFTSQNINRPTVEKACFSCNEQFDIFNSILKEDYNIDYEDASKEYTVLSTKKENSQP